MPYFHACGFCGCNLDPGETCDCTERARAIRQETTSRARDQTAPSITHRTEARTGATIPLLRAIGRRPMARR